MDTLPAAVRSSLMARVRRVTTGPELTVRSALHALGFRFRLHRRDLPGTPDVVLSKYKVAVFVQGCFWHQHGGCKKATLPKTRSEFWSAKLSENVARDRRVRQRLIDMGWRYFDIWECETTPLEALSVRINELQTILSANA